MPREDITQHEFTDDDLVRMVTNAIAWSGNVHYSEIGVEADAGVVRLYGLVENPSEKDAAYDVAVHVPDVTQVVNDIKVNIPDALSDVDIAERVCDELARDARVDANFIEVSAEKGVVTLSGEVVIEAEKLAALSTAKSVYGVTDVVDKIAVLPTTDTDHALAGLVAATLGRTSNLDEKGIAVFVKNGVVRLAGSVGSDFERDTAASVVESLPGVQSVENDLKVRGR